MHNYGTKVLWWLWEGGIFCFGYNKSCCGVIWRYIYKAQIIFHNFVIPLPAEWKEKSEMHDCPKNSASRPTTWFLAWKNIKGTHWLCKGLVKQLSFYGAVPFFNWMCNEIPCMVEQTRKCKYNTDHDHDLRNVNNCTRGITKSRFRFKQATNI